MIERVRIDKVNWYDEGSPVEVTCKVKSYPESNITWSMNFGEVIPSGKEPRVPELNIIWYITFGEVFLSGKKPRVLKPL